MMRVRIGKVMALLGILLCIGTISVANGYGQTGPAEGKRIVTVLKAKQRIGQALMRGTETNGPEEDGAFLPSVIYTDSGMFYITNESQVIGQNEKAIIMNDLALPCEAEVVFQQLPRNVRNVLLLRVRRLMPGATKAWRAPEPE